MKKTVSERQLDANRANALKSTGPRTEAGKRVSRYNSIQHGLTAGTVCLPGELKEVYDALRMEYWALIQPANAIEEGLADDLAATRWRKNRLIRTENGLIREQMLRLRPELEKRWTVMSFDVEVSLSIKALGDNSKCAERLDRYEARLERNFRTILKQILELKRLNQLPGGAFAHDPAIESQPVIETQPIDFQNEAISEPPPAPAPEPPPLGQASAPYTLVLNPDQGSETQESKDVKAKSKNLQNEAIPINGQFSDPCSPALPDSEPSKNSKKSQNEAIPEIGHKPMAMAAAKTPADRVRTAGGGS